MEVEDVGEGAALGDGGSAREVDENVGIDKAVD